MPCWSTRRTPGNRSTGSATGSSGQASGWPLSTPHTGTATTGSAPTSWQRFPGAIAYATEGTIQLMHKQATEGRAQVWDKDFPGLIPDSPVVYQPIPSVDFELEGNRIRAIETGHTDTEDTTVLHVPSLGLVVAGDVAYNGVHQYLLETVGGGLEAWLKAIDQVAALRPRAVVAGHKNKDLPLPDPMTTITPPPTQGAGDRARATTTETPPHRPAHKRPTRHRMEC
jgi:glyoxylase-like metal-dependent hydrolase (beta-lactamase superfamily II)